MNLYGVIEGRPLPKRCVIGLQEKLGFVGDREIARTVTGKAVVLEPAYGSLYTVELSNSGQHVWLPHQFAVGDLVTVFSQTWQSVVLGYAQTSVELARNPFRLSAHSITDGAPVVITQLSGRLVRIAAHGNDTVISYRMKLRCIVVDVQSSGSATSPEQSWTLKLEEVGE